MKKEERPILDKHKDRMFWRKYCNIGVRRKPLHAKHIPVRDQQPTIKGRE